MEGSLISRYLLRAILSLYAHSFAAPKRAKIPERSIHKTSMAVHRARDAEVLGRPHFHDINSSDDSENVHNHRASLASSDTPSLWTQYVWELHKPDADALVACLPHASLFEDEKDETAPWTVMYWDETGQGLPTEVAAKWPRFRIETVADMDWVQAYQDILTPLEIGEFYIHTSHHPKSAHHRFCLQLDAKMAFGSGHHETTRGCLAAIQDLWAQDPWGRALDWGCGSGILALAMNQLSPGSTIAMDNDPEAVQETCINALTNLIPTQAVCGQAWEDVADQGPYDVIVANLFSALLIRLAHTFHARRYLILSGMMVDQEAGVIQAFSDQGWQVHMRYPLGQWVTVWLRRAIPADASAQGQV